MIKASLIRSSFFISGAESPLFFGDYRKIIQKHTRALLISISSVAYGFHNTTDA